MNNQNIVGQIKEKVQDMEDDRFNRLKVTFYIG